jgi:hypothetical protein
VRVKVKVVFELSFLVECNNTLFHLCVAIGGHGHGYVNFMCNGMLELW